MSKVTVNLLKLLKYGSITISDHSKKILEISFFDKEKKINIVDFSSNVPNTGITFNKLIQARNFAKTLKENGVTVYIYHKNKIIMKLGHGAKSRFSLFFVRSENIEITNINELRRLDKRIRLK